VRLSFFWYSTGMTKLLEKAIEVVRKLAPERQDEVASMILSVSSEAPVELTVDELQAVEAGLADADAGRFATDEEVEALFAKFRAA
jgi:predicted transcriptional regulator